MIIMESIKFNIDTVFTSIRKFVEVDLVDEEMLKEDLKYVFKCYERNGN